MVSAGVGYSAKLVVHWHESACTNLVLHITVGADAKVACVSNCYRNAMGDRFGLGNATAGCDAVDVSGAKAGSCAITGHCVVDVLVLVLLLVLVKLDLDELIEMVELLV